jgi:hypothetical protein
MTLNKHEIKGLKKFDVPTISSIHFQQMMEAAGYSISASAPAKGGRFKVWWSHSSHPRVESIYSPDKVLVITAYHVY